ncbi:L,D-transpeptidase family protein [Streptomyces sp. G45]|uniref:L,D-transpeptidase family protein n=1 Tax=Streptomyces sp. G45 TaxID=3406627 RepID=UPI003C169BF7
MRISGVVRTAAVAAACSVLSLALTSCGGGADGDGGAARHDRGAGGRDVARPAADPKRIPDVGDRWQSRIPKDTRQVVAVYGEGGNSARARVVLYTKTRTKTGNAWKGEGSWPAHNGKRGWTLNHHEGDKRSPVGVFTLTDAGGVLANPGAKIPYTQTGSIQAPRSWPKTHWHDFDYVIAIDYNRAKGTPPNDPTRPQGQAKGGSIWLHMDHGSGTSGCVSLSKSGMRHLLRTLDPKQHPVVVMGDRAALRS